MAKATVGAAGIEFIQGALLKPKKSAGHKHGNYLIMTHRSAPTTNPNCQRIYSKPADAYTRTTPVSADELAVRTRFATIAAQVAARSKDVSTYAADWRQFQAQKDTPGGAKTFKAYLWRLLGAVYDDNQG